LLTHERDEGRDRDCRARAWWNGTIDRQRGTDRDDRHVGEEAAHQSAAAAEERNVLEQRGPIRLEGVQRDRQEEK